MKATKGLNIKDKSGYFFTVMTNINNFDPDLLIINEIAVFNMDQLCMKLVTMKNVTHHMLFLIT